MDNWSIYFIYIYLILEKNIKTFINTLNFFIFLRRFFLKIGILGAGAMGILFGGLLSKNGNKVKFLTDSFSYSSKHVLRGLHGDFQTWKLITCVKGSIYLVVVNNINYGKEYKRWINLELSKEFNTSLLVPPGYGVGYFVRSKEAIVHYKQSTLYDRKKQFSIKWDDNNFEFKWPTKKPILSERDK